MTPSNLVNGAISTGNAPPTANASGPYSGTPGVAISFTGAGSSDPENNPLTYAWSFGDGGTATGVSPSHSYAVAGSYTVSLVVNDGQLSSSPATATVTVASAPDLVMTALSTTATAVGQGGTVSVSNTVKNQGSAPAAGFAIVFHLSVNSSYGDSDDIVSTTTRTLSSLSSNASSTSSATSIVIPAEIPLGNYYLCAKADGANAIGEANEVNNTRCTPTTVQVVNPDLVLTEVTPAATTVTAGSALSVTSGVQNQGLAAAGISKVDFKLSLDNVYSNSDIAITSTRSVAGLAAGASSTATSSLTIATSTPPNTYYLCAKTDSAGTVVETDEANNTLCSVMQVTILPPDLVISALSTTATNAAAGGSLPLVNTINNQGGAQAGNSTAAFAFSLNALYGDSDDIAVTTVRSVAPLNAGGASTATTNIAVPITLPVGTYYLCGYADTGHVVTEGHEDNNGACTSSQVAVTPPDLIVTTLSTTSTSITAGTSIPVSNAITNQGGARAGSSVVAFHLSTNTVYGDSDDVPSNTRAISFLNGNGTSTASTNMITSATVAPGSYYICIRADDAAAVAESDEGNNTACTGTTVIIQ